MSNPTNADVKKDVGQLWSAISGTTTTVVNGLLSRAKNDIKDITGTTTGITQDRAIRSLADAFVCQHAIGSLGPETDGNNIAMMRDQFYKDTNNALQRVGKALSYYSIQFVKVNP
jgi:hypothetical protein